MNNFKYFWEIITKKEKKIFLVIILLYIAQAIFEMIGIASVIPFVTFLLKPEALSEIPIISNLINFNEIQFNENFIIFMCIIFFSIFLIKNILIILTNKITYNFIFSVRTNLYLDILKKIMHQNYLFFVREGIPKIANILSIEVNNFAISIVKPIINLVSEIIITLAIILLIYVFGYFDGLIILLPLVVVIGFILKKLNKSIKNWSKLRITNNQKLISLKYNFINSIKEIIIYGKIIKIFDEFKSSLKNLQKVDTNNNVVMSIPKALLEQSIILVFIITILFLKFSGVSYENIIITVSFYLAVAYRLVPSFNKIFIANQGLKFGEPSITKLMEFKELKNENIFLENENTDKIINFKNNIQLSNIFFKYNNNLDVIKNLNLVINKYDIIGIHGESGSGKSTLINILTFLLKTNKGKIIVDGNELNELDRIRKYQNLFSIASQDTFLIDGTLKDNIIFGSDKSYSETRIKESINFARLSEFVNSLELGLDTHIGSTIKQLSSGQKQRIAIARSIYSDREILIFDEATNALDEKNEKLILKNINDLELKKTIIIISHNLDNLKICKRIISIQNHEIIEKKN
tara:strand:+ start:183 stop:1916 length:1734 start_codon:yes stop_codon:yes gene_type:complete